MNASLGGPGPGCSAMKVRRLLAGELLPGEKERVAEHVASCARCQETGRELAEERAQLRDAVPFEVLAAGVADKLAVGERRGRRGAGSRWAKAAGGVAGLAVAASLLLAIFVARRPPEETVRSKGGVSAILVAQGAQGLREVGTEGVSPDARLKIVLKGVSRREEVILLIEPGETSLLYAGPAREGAQPGAFYWTGSASRASLLIVLADTPLDAVQLKAQGRAGAPSGADLLELPLTR